MSMKTDDPIRNRTRDFSASSAVSQPTAPPIYRVLLEILVSLSSTYPGKGFMLGKARVKFTLEQATKVQRGSRGIALLFL
jgi:hypothetical protein